MHVEAARQVHGIREDAGGIDDAAMSTTSAVQPDSVPMWLIGNFPALYDV
jgi:hypothetical protein